MNEMERRQFIKKGMIFSVGFLTGGVLLLGCGNGQKEGREEVKEKEGGENGKDPCDMAALSANELKSRNALGYVDKTPMKEKRCDNCKLFIPAGDKKACATCPLFKGPVLPKGYCTYWAPKGV